MPPLFSRWGYSHRPGHIIRDRNKKIKKNEMKNERKKEKRGENWQKIIFYNLQTVTGFGGLVGGGADGKKGDKAFLRRLLKVHLQKTLNLIFFLGGGAGAYTGGSVPPLELRCFHTFQILN